ncbi:MAG TPA: EamA family transporter [Rhizobium sp.]|nr:EamA family transporter [Rhizobium sp.]
MRPVVWLTIVAMIAFAANSLLARLALGSASLDWASYTTLRILAGAAVLALLVRGRDKAGGSPAGRWPAAVALLVYALAFSLAYLELGAATGALILFTSVQATMVGYSLIRGESLTLAEMLGFTVAFVAFVYLVLPGVGRPDPTGSLLMAVSGIAWGIYTLKGRGGGNPLAATGGNFLYASVLCVPIGIFALLAGTATWVGIFLAVFSGAVTSGLGYVIWYRALAGLTNFQAALVQLSVPVIAAAGAIVFLDEAMTVRFAISGSLVIGGIGLAIMARQKARAG